jgi:Flp pilus assembly protein TadG
VDRALTGRRRRADADRGSIAIELAVLGPALMLVFGLIIAAGRLANAHNAVDNSAAAAARAASLARTAPSARDAARDAAQRELAGRHCTAVTVAVNTAGFAVPVGQPATVRVTVTCPVRLSDIGLPGLGSRTVTATAVSPIDTRRERR